MTSEVIQQEIDRLAACIEKVRADFKPRFDALHSQYWPYVSTNRYPADVKARMQHEYKQAYIDLCGGLMRAIQVYSYPKMALRIELKERERIERMKEKFA